MNTGPIYRDGDTIVAPATAPLPAGVAVLRLSGPEAWPLAAQLCPKLAGASPRRMLWSPLEWQGDVVDEAMVVGFKAPASFTGEDVVELHTHGGRAVVQAVLDALLGMGARMALPGEFSRRAVLNGKMDLTAAEGLADLIAADTDVQRRQALRQMEGALGERFEGWRKAVLNLLAQVEAAIDFPDEELDVLSAPGLVGGLQKVLEDLQAGMAEEAGRRVRDGVALALVGLPNAGKSTLLNLLSGRDVAIVSAMAGTTRDVVTNRLDVAGYPVTVADTAGVRETRDAIEAEGVRRARRQAEQADIVIGVVDGSRGFDLPAEVAELLVEGASMVVVSHADVMRREAPTQVEVDGAAYPVAAVNLTDRAALGKVVPVLAGLVEAVAGRASDAALLTRERHRAAVREAIAALGNALVAIGKGQGGVAELVAQDLREAAAAIGSVTGRTGSEDVLDVVFSTFCIGK